MSNIAWTVRLGESAEQDFADITSWTVEQFGPRQAVVYAEAVSEALIELAANPFMERSAARDQDIGAGFRTLHMAKSGRRGRHLFLYRCDEKAGSIIVVRILHDSMDIARHRPSPAADD